MALKKYVSLALTSLMFISINSFADVSFESTKDGSKLPITAKGDDTAEAKEFIATGKNPYTMRFTKDAEAAKAGKKKFGYYSCTQCHGGNAGGAVGPALTDDVWNYAKNATDKGMFETIAGGTANGMNNWHKDVANNPDLLSTDDILQVMGWLRSINTAKERPWEK